MQEENSERCLMEVMVLKDGRLVAVDVAAVLWVGECEYE